ncbi:MAG: Jag N-terminal domain-containing protein [Desulfovibrio sp.]|jgi:spoIIIJ-associated protein|nr:Jag N-terminal domain-containing protein [Desulfovibrio sp.]
MNIWKDFQGKTIDDAIREACHYFGVERERLEIEIVNDATPGIFGLMGGKKAAIRASRVSLSDLLGLEPESVSPAAGESLPPEARSRTEVRHGRGGRSDPDRFDGRGKGGRGPRSAADGRPSPAEDSRSREEEDPSSAEVPGRSSHRQEGGPWPVLSGESAAGPEETAQEELPEFDPRNCDQAALLELITDTVSRLVRPIVGEMTSSVTFAGNRVRVSIDCGEFSGLLLGREGQTLAAVQYVAGRIIAKHLGSSLRLQFDAGNYRERQDGFLRELALSLAEKVKVSRRPQSTRPLSAYQRRIIHLALEGDDLVQTFSKGEGNQRRVVIQLKRAERVVCQTAADALGREESSGADPDAGCGRLPEDGTDPSAGGTPEDLSGAASGGVPEDSRNNG